LTKPFKLEPKAREFADELAEILNGTVCAGIRLSHVMSSSGISFIGHQITKQLLSRADGFELGGRKHSGIYMSLSYQLVPDDQREYLMVSSSFVGLSTDARSRQELIHFDYERDKSHGYPEAHMQVFGSSNAWSAALKECGKPLSALHLPVGGRRFRPTLEDILEFLIVEGLVDGHQGWSEVVQKHREEFHRKQLWAAIRRSPEEAREAYRVLHGETI
jgi:hypothetical protein